MHKKPRAGGLVGSILLPMGLICLFAFCTLALSLLGGSAYRTIQDSVTDEYANIIATNYLRTKLSQNNVQGAVELRETEGVQVLVVHRDFEGVAYETRIYVHDGVLRESYSLAEREFDPSGGDMLTEVQSCRFVLQDSGLFEAYIVTPEGDETRVAFLLAGGGAA